MAANALSPTYDDQQQQQLLLQKQGVGTSIEGEAHPKESSSSPVKSIHLVKQQANEDDGDDSIPRLRSVANYGPFSPTGLACCTGLSQSEYSSDGDNDGGRRDKGEGHDNRASSDYAGRASVGFGGGSHPRVSFSATAAGGVEAPSPFAAGTAIALSGPHGIAILRSNKPHIPTVVLSHSTPTPGGASGPLAFQPTWYEDDSADSSAGDKDLGNGAGRSTLLLATARGSGVLVWDASGRSLSPLLGRLGHDGRHPPAALVPATATAMPATVTSNTGSATGAAPTAPSALSSRPPKPAGSSKLPPSTAASNITPAVSPISSPRPATVPYSVDYERNRITSLCWLSPHKPMILTTSALSACVWDLRCPSISRLRPAMRFEIFDSDAEFVSCAVGGDGSNEVAIMDSSGVVRIYDARMGGGGSGAQQQHHPLHAFYAHDSSGVGISRLPLSKTGRRGWLTWGFDAGAVSGVIDGSVKVWREGRRSSAAEAEISIDSDDYWNPSTDVAAAVTSAASAAAADSRRFELTSMFGSGDLSTARVVPYPYTNGVVTVGATQNGDWMADIWTLDEQDSPGENGSVFSAAAENAIVNGVYGARLEASFEGGYNTNAALKQVLGGKTDMGYLIQADLAVGLPEIKDSGQSGAAELLLCCLGNTGYLTTHAIPEATTKQTPEFITPSGVTTVASSPKRQMASHRLIRPDVGGGAVSAVERRLFRPKSDPNFRLGFEKTRNEGPLGASRPDYGQGLRSEGNEQLYSSELSTVNPDDAIGHGRSAVFPELNEEDGIGGIADPSAHISRGVEGALMQFDIDVPGEVDVIAAGTTPIGGPPSPGAVVDARAKNITEPPSSSATQASIDPFKAMRVPCPRLCGANFGRGGGGMIVFHNGDVRKLWSWFQSEQQGPKADLKQQQRQNKSVEVDRKVRVVPSSSGSAKRRSPSAMQQCPRTMLDLMRMGAAAKIAQWGVDRAEDDSDSDGQSDDESADVSSDSSHSSSSESEEFESFFLQQTTADGGPVEEDSGSSLDIATAASSRNAKEKTAAGSMVLTPYPLSQRLSFKRSGRKLRSGPEPDDAFVNPATDHLAPVVTFTLQYDATAMNGQCPELADGMEFGPWGVCCSTGAYPSSTALGGSRVSSRSSGLHSEGWGWIEETEKATSENTSYRTIFPSLASMGRQFSMKGRAQAPSKDDKAPLPLSPSKSFPSIYHVLAAETTPLPPLLTRTTDSAQKRPSSLSGNLKSLFYSQSPDDIAAVPPDQNMLPKARPRLPSRNRDESFTELTNTSAGSSADREVDLGVHMIAQPEDLSYLALEQLDRTVELCLYNASVCLELTQSGKADTWSLLAQAVGHLSKDVRDGYDGWGGPGGGALGCDLVASILQFYELHGDVQMLATIVCVLSGGADRRMGHRGLQLEQEVNSGIRNLLPDDDKRLDFYIFRYASLLYAWGKLTTRTELNKHLAHGGGDEMLIPIEPGDPGRLQKDCTANEGSVPSITFAPLCPSCHKPASPQTNFCNSCRQYAFKCSICMNAVRGLFTTCLKCGHGGHVDHLLPWFEKETTCPTGCGCSCVLTTYTSEKVVAVGSDKAIQAKEFAPRIRRSGWQ